jgi:hypothetical protein
MRAIDRLYEAGNKARRNQDQRDKDGIRTDNDKNGLRTDNGKDGSEEVRMIR